jgi:hypothetical protein
MPTSFFLSDPSSDFLLYKACRNHELSFSIKKYAERFEESDWEWSQMHKWFCDVVLRYRVPSTHKSLTGSSSPFLQYPCFARAVMYSLQTDNRYACHLFYLGRCRFCKAELSFVMICSGNLGLLCGGLCSVQTDKYYLSHHRLLGSCCMLTDGLPRSIDITLAPHFPKCSFF